MPVTGVSRLIRCKSLWLLTTASVPLDLVSHILVLEPCTQHQSIWHPSHGCRKRGIVASFCGRVNSNGLPQHISSRLSLPRQCRRVRHSGIRTPCARVGTPRKFLSLVVRLAKCPNDSLTGFGFDSFDIMRVLGSIGQWEVRADAVVFMGTT
jgi:hypothetical protein